MIAKPSGTSHNALLLIPEDADDILTLRRLLEKDDKLIADTSRVVKQESDYGRPDRGERVKVRVSLKVEQSQLDSAVDRLRISGTITEADNVLFCALTMQAVGRAAYRMMLECRIQFERMRAYLRDLGKDEAFIANPDNWPSRPVDYRGGQIPDYAKAVAISTAGAQREMVIPSLLAIVVPVVVGLIFDVPGVMGLLAGGATYVLTGRRAISDVSTSEPNE